MKRYLKKHQLFRLCLLIILLNLPVLTAWANTSITATGNKPVALLFHQSGKFAYVVNNGSNTISQYNYNSSTGDLSSMPVATVATGIGVTFGASLSPSGKFLLVAAQDQNLIYIYAIDQKTGMLTLIEKFNTVLGPIQTQFSLDGKFMYILSITSNQIYQYSFNDETGEMQPLTPLSVRVHYTPTGIGLSNDGKYMYEISASENNTTRYTINQVTGQLTENETYPVGNYPVYSNFDPSGTLSLCVNINSNDISVFKTDIATGKMEYSSSVYSTLANRPNSLPVYDKTGKYVYIANEGSNNISQYKLDLDNKTLIKQSPEVVPIKGYAPDWLVMSPDYKYLFVVNANSNNVQRLTIGADGTLSSEE